MTVFISQGTDGWWTRCFDYEPLWIPMFWLAVAFWIGCCAGSFLNVCIWRIPRDESVVSKPSHCPKCNTPLAWYDNIPIWGFCWLRGKCRYCRAPISPRYLGMELLVGAIFAAILAKVGWSEQPPSILMGYFGMAMLTVTTFFIDKEHRLIPDVTTYPAMVWGIVAAGAFPGAWGFGTWYQGAVYALISALVCGGALALFRTVGGWIAKQEVLGWGDVKYLMAAGALLGLPGAFFTLLAGSVAGSVYGVALALRRGRKLRGTAIPLGPFLASASLGWIFLGEKLLTWYVTLLPVR